MDDIGQMSLFLREGFNGTAEDFCERFWVGSMQYIFPEDIISAAGIGYTWDQARALSEEEKKSALITVMLNDLCEQTRAPMPG